MLSLMNPMAQGARTGDETTVAKEKGNKTVPTGNMLDYVLWRGDLTFDRDPWNEIDSLIVSVASYSNLGENELLLEEGASLSLAEIFANHLLLRLPQMNIPGMLKDRDELLEYMASSPRYRQIRFVDQVHKVDEGRSTQFSALTLQVPDVGTVIGFRGTEPSLVAWKEDFMMGYMCPVPAQTEALNYLRRIADLTSGPILLSGHSKGGNLAVYSAAHTSPEIQARLTSICSFDGPGLDDDTMASEGYRLIAPRIHSIIPVDSVVGRLMNYHPVYRVVKTAKSSSFLEHDPFNWNLIGNHFQEVEDVSRKSILWDRSLHEWIKTCTPHEREVFVTAIFAFFSRIWKSREGASVSFDDSTQSMDEPERQMVFSLLYRLISIHLGRAYAAKVQQPLLQATSELREWMNSAPDPRYKSDLVQIDNQWGGYNEAVAETRRMAEFCGLNRKDSLRMQLFTEEMMSMLQTVTGETKATFWITCAGRHVEMHMETKTVMDKQKRALLIASSKSGKNDAARSFLGRLRSFFEQAMLSDQEETIYALSPGSEERPAGVDWDRYEQSVLNRLADDVRIGIRGDTVSMIVCKTFPEELSD